MTKRKLYRYVGKNGLITTPIILIGVEGIPMYGLMADTGKILTDGNVFKKAVEIFEEDLPNWIEVDWVKENK